ncbi:MAG: hypothetical protein QM756_08730 [Polyangiaceae bacterium]
MGSSRFERVLRGAKWLGAALQKHAVLLIGLVWFAAMLSLVLWIWGLKPVVFPSSDEAANRMTALVIRRTGRPMMSLPFRDEEDLAHLRAWISVGDQVLPGYPPVTFYLFALLTLMGKFGYFLIYTLPAGAAGAFAAGTALLQPVGRRWLGLFAPILGFPATYWLLRPWINLALLLTCLCWAFFFWSGWRKFRRTYWLAGAMGCVGAAIAVRPDYAPYALPVALLFSLGAERSAWKQEILLLVVAAALAVGANLFLNWLITGHPTRAAYQMMLEKDVNNDFRGPVRMLQNLVFPMGFPARDDALNFLKRYWLEMGPVALLLAAQLALIPLLWAEKRVARLLYLGAIALMVLFLFTRMDKTLHGGLERISVTAHSIPRYWSPIYLFAGLPPLLFLGRCKRRLIVLVGALFVATSASLGAHNIMYGQPTSLAYIENFVRVRTAWLEQVAARVPADAFVYSRRSDKELWSRFRVGLLEEPEPSAISMNRAVEAGLAVYIFGERNTAARRALWRALQRRRLVPVRFGPLHDFYKLEPLAPEATGLRSAPDQKPARLALASGG